jgi:hypothetical protein
VYAEDETWSVSSPQIPGFVGGRGSREDLARDLADMLRFACVDTEELTVRIHEEALIPMDEGDLVLRVASDDQFEERREVAERLRSALADDIQREDMLDAPRTPTGGVLYLCAVTSDTIRWCVEQLHPDGDGAVAAVCVAEEMIWAAHFFTGANAPGQPLEHFGFSLDTTLSEIMQAQVIANRPRRLAVAV